MKRSKRISAIQQDKNRPSKPAAPPAGIRAAASASAGVKVPTYDGPSKTDKMPQLKPETRTNRTKVAVDPKALKNHGACQLRCTSKTRSLNVCALLTTQLPKASSISESGSA